MQTQDYLNENNIFYKYQSGFRTKHSTDTCISLLNDRILTDIDNGMLTCMILLDLQKYFDTIDHEIFFSKWYICVLASLQFLGTGLI